MTHYWLTRRWLHGDARTMLDEPPWTPDYQLRLVRNDPALLWFPGVTHWPIEAVGPHRYVEEPLYHTDLLLNPLERRREKSSRYERLLPGKRVGGLPLNHAYYLPEDRAEALACTGARGGRAAHRGRARRRPVGRADDAATETAPRDARGGRRALARTRPVAAAVPGAARAAAETGCRSPPGRHAVSTCGSRTRARTRGRPALSANPRCA